MKCEPISTSPGLPGPLANIREACNSVSTSIFKDTLGLFHLTCPCFWFAMPQTLTVLSFSPPPQFLLHPLFFLLHLFLYKASVFFTHSSHVWLLFIHFCGFLEFKSSRGTWRHEPIPPPPCHPCILFGQKAASVMRRSICGWWCSSWFFFGLNHSQSGDRGFDLAFYSSGLFFTSAVAPRTLRPAHFWWNLHHMPFERRWPNWWACFSLTCFPGHWFDQIPTLMGGSAPILS